MKRNIQKLTILIAVLASAILSSVADDFSAGLVFQRDRALPVVAAQVWADEGIHFFGGTPSVDALAGYDTNGERMHLGYQLAWNWRLTENTGIYAGAAYLAPIGEIAFGDLWDKIGIAAGFKVKL